MEIDREVLIELLKALLDASEATHRELEFYRTLFLAACKAKGLNETEIRALEERARGERMAKIAAQRRSDHQSLLEKVPRIVELLASDQAAALRLLQEWTPKGPPQ